MGSLHARKIKAGAQPFLEPGEEVLSAVPLADVDSIEVKRLLLGKTLTLTVRGTPIKLEANAAAGAHQLADALSEVKARGATPAAGR